MYPPFNHCLIIFLYNLNFMCKILVCKNEDNWNIFFYFGLSTRFTKKSRRRFLLTLWRTLVTCFISKGRTSNSSLIKSKNINGSRLQKTTSRGLSSLSWNVWNSSFSVFGKWTSALYAVEIEVWIFNWFVAD